MDVGRSGVAESKITYACRNTFEPHTFKQITNPIRECDACRLTECSNVGVGVLCVGSVFMCVEQFMLDAVSNKFTVKAN